MKCVDQIIQNPIRNVLVENALIPKLLQVHFQTFQLDAKLIRHVLERESSEIRLSRFGTDRRELRANDLNQIIPMGTRILKGFKHFQ